LRKIHESTADRLGLDVSSADANMLLPHSAQIKLVEFSSFSLPLPMAFDLPQTLAYLASAPAIRERCGQLFQLACTDQLRYFQVDLTQLPAVASYVLRVTRDSYPDLQIPFHSRWRHFEVGSVARLSELDQVLATGSPLERARTKVDLVVVSVLLDAGAGSDWHYREAKTGQIWRRSEGLAIASFRLFCQGLFAADLDRPLRVTAQGLQALTAAALAAGMQVRQDNPLVGLAGRLQLLHQLGQVLQQQPHFFGNAGSPRPGHLVDFFLQYGSSIPANVILKTVLQAFGPIWPGRITLAGISLGDVWPHSALSGEDPGQQLVPFHKLSQWLTYSLLEPLQELGLQITDLDGLTGLPEYRNGGLCLDLGLLQIKDPDLLNHSHPVGSEFVVEWRALTVCLLDQIAVAMRKQLGLNAEQLPLAKVLQGGTWTAGRRIAAERRAGGGSPVLIESDGTVF
jgi:hypothetical protein